MDCDDGNKLNFPCHAGLHGLCPAVIAQCGGDFLYRDMSTQVEEPRVRATYSQTTPESAELGDYSDTGWLDQNGQSMELDNYDIADGLTVAAKAVRYIKAQGAVFASSSHFHLGVWYSTQSETIDYPTGTQEERSFHLKGFTEEQERTVWDLFHKIDTLPQPRKDQP